MRVRKGAKDEAGRRILHLIQIRFDDVGLRLRCLLDLSRIGLFNLGRVFISQDGQSSLDSGQTWLSLVSFCLLRLSDMPVDSATSNTRYGLKQEEMHNG